MTESKVDFKCLIFTGFIFSGQKRKDSCNSRQNDLPILLLQRIRYFLSFQFKVSNFRFVPNRKEIGCFTGATLLGSCSLGLSALHFLLVLQHIHFLSRVVLCLFNPCGLVGQIPVLTKRVCTCQVSTFQSSSNLIIIISIVLSDTQLVGSSSPDDRLNLGPSQSAGS